MTGGMGQAEDTIENQAGCGRFQICMVLLVGLLGLMSSECSLVFMAFGAYDPGWKCMATQNKSSTNTLNREQAITTLRRVSHSYGIDSEHPPKSVNLSSVVSFYVLYFNNASGYDGQCSDLPNCHGGIVFDPHSSTLVTEWGLICDKAWIPLFIASIQMFGIFIGCLFAGHIADVFGRKRAVYSATATLALFSFVSIFSTSWEVFSVIMFCIGVSCGFTTTLYFVFTAEFLPKKWRGILMGLPLHYVGASFGGIFMMILKNWKYVNITTGIAATLGLVPAVYFPESLRWLETQDKRKQFQKATERILRCNGKLSADTRNILSNNEGKSTMWNDQQAVIDTKAYNISYLFKKDYRLYTILLCFPWFITTLISYSISFGIRVLQSDFYITLVALITVQIPFSVFAVFLPNIFGRKRASYTFAAVCSLAFIAATLLELFAPQHISIYTVSIFIITARVAINCFWCTLCTITLEIYPTVVRALGYSYGNSMARLGAMVAPFMFPSGSDSSSTYITYIIMAVLAFCCILFLIKLPETKGITLKETYYETIDGINDLDLAENQRGKVSRSKLKYKSNPQCSIP